MEMPRIEMRTTLLMVWIVSLVIGISGCDTGERSQGVGLSAEAIVIGNSSAVSGPASFLGTQYLRGHEIYFSAVNEQGGIHGRRIRVVSYDDQYDPPQTVATTKKLIEEDGVFMLFGYVGTPTSVKIIDMVHEAEIPAFGFLTGAETLRTPFRPNMFHVRASYYAEAEAAVEYFVDHLGLEQISIVYQDDAFGYAVLKGVQLALQRRGIGLVSTATIVRGSMDVGPAVRSIREGGAEAVIMVGTYSPLAKFIDSCHELDYYPYFDTVSFVGSEAFASELIEVNRIDPAQYERIIVTQVVPSPYSDEYDVVKEFREMFSRRYPEEPLNYVALEGYINARVLTHVLAAAGSQVSRDSLIKQLEALSDFDTGLGQSITYSPYDHKGLERIFYSRLHEDGTFRTFEH
jgi:ABC-type branched-subunit amino acid transport system substrate-binding protein